MSKHDQCRGNEMPEKVAIPTSNGDNPSGVATSAPAAAPSFHDFRDTGDPLEKVYPIPDWRAWERRTEFDNKD